MLKYYRWLFCILVTNDNQCSFHLKVFNNTLPNVVDICCLCLLGTHQGPVSLSPHVDLKNLSFRVLYSALVSRAGTILWLSQFVYFLLLFTKDWRRGRASTQAGPGSPNEVQSPPLTLTYKDQISLEVPVAISDYRTHRISLRMMTLLRGMLN